jgi:hypothetical protein
MFLDVAAAGCLQSCDVGPVGNLDNVANWPKFRPQIEKGPHKGSLTRDFRSQFFS